MHGPCSWNEYIHFKFTVLVLRDLQIQAIIFMLCVIEYVEEFVCLLYCCWVGWCGGAVYVSALCRFTVHCVLHIRVRNTYSRVAVVGTSTCFWARNIQSMHEVSTKFAPYKHSCEPVTVVRVWQWHVKYRRVATTRTGKRHRREHTHIHSGSLWLCFSFDVLCYYGYAEVCVCIYMCVYMCVYVCTCVCTCVCVCARVSWRYDFRIGSQRYSKHRLVYPFVSTTFTIRARRRGSRWTRNPIAVATNRTTPNNIVTVCNWRSTNHTWIYVVYIRRSISTVWTAT